MVALVNSLERIPSFMGLRKSNDPKKSEYKSTTTISIFISHENSLTIVFSHCTSPPVPLTREVVGFIVNSNTMRRKKIAKKYVHNNFHLTYLLYLPLIFLLVVYMWSISVRTATKQTKTLAEKQRQLFENPPRQGNITYLVKEGDTLESVAQEFEISLNTIRWANNLPSDKLQVGSIIIIPPITGVVHIVQSGETIESIAKKYYASPDDIRNYPYNRFSEDEPFPLIVGEPLYVPYGRK